MHQMLLRRTSFSILLVLSVALLIAADNTPVPPVAKKVPHVTEVNGHKMVDNYAWLREKSNPEVRAYLEKENAYTDSIMKPTEPLQKKLYDEMLSRIKETDVEVPYREGDYFYYTRTEAGKQYSVYCRKKANMDAAEEILLDVNQLAQGHTFMTVAAFAVSPDGNLLAYSYDNTGFRQFSLAVKDLRNRADARRPCRARWIRGVGERQSDRFLHTRGRHIQEAVSALPSHGGIAGA